MKSLQNERAQSIWVRIKGEAETRGKKRKREIVVSALSLWVAIQVLVCTLPERASEGGACCPLPTRGIKPGKQPAVSRLLNSDPQVYIGICLCSLFPRGFLLDTLNKNDNILRIRLSATRGYEKRNSITQKSPQGEPVGLRCSGWEASLSLPFMPPRLAGAGQREQVSAAEEWFCDCPTSTLSEGQEKSMRTEREVERGEEWRGREIGEGKWTKGGRNHGLNDVLMPSWARIADLLSKMKLKEEVWDSCHPQGSCI